MGAYGDSPTGEVGQDAVDAVERGAGHQADEEFFSHADGDVNA
jgi:hypothetical protein